MKYPTSLPAIVLLAVGCVALALITGIFTAGAVADLVKAALTVNVRTGFPTNPGQLIDIRLTRLTNPGGSLVGASTDYVPGTYIGTTAGRFDYFVGNHQLLTYLDPGDAMDVRVSGSSSGPFSAAMKISGYLLDCSSPPCAAIVNQ